MKILSIARGASTIKRLGNPALLESLKTLRDKLRRETNAVTRITSTKEMALGSTLPFLRWRLPNSKSRAGDICRKLIAPKKGISKVEIRPTQHLFMPNSLYLKM